MKTFKTTFAKAALTIGLLIGATAIANAQNYDVRMITKETMPPTGAKLVVGRGAATMFTNAPIFELQRGQNVGVQLNAAATNSATGNFIAYYRVTSDPKQLIWSPTLVSVTNALTGTTAIPGIITLTNGVSFPGTAKWMQLQWVTNQDAVSCYITNAIAATWETQK